MRSATAIKLQQIKVSGMLDLGQNFLLVDLRDFFFRLRVGGTEKKEKKALKMTS